MYKIDKYISIVITLIVGCKRDYREFAFGSSYEIYDLTKTSLWCSICFNSTYVLALRLYYAIYELI